MDMTDLYQQAESILAGTQKAYERIRSDGRLTDDGKRRQVAQVYVKARDRLDQIRRAASEQRAAETKRLEDKAFKIDPADMPSYRDALDRVGRLEDSPQLLTLIDRAAKTGDRVQLRAAAAWSADQGAGGDILDVLAEHLPGEIDAVRALARSRHDARASRLQDGMYFGLAQPPELAGPWMNRVDDLARSEPVS